MQLAKIARNLASVARHKGLAGEYLGWLARSALTGGQPCRRLFGGITVGGFANFSEYHSIPDYITEAELRLFETMPIGEGPIIDVGANIGLVSLLFARRFPGRTIHAFEPNPTTFKALEANVARNGASNIICHRCALSEVTGSVMFNSDPVDRATASISNGAGMFAQEVLATTLDAFMAEQEIDKVGLLKIDVEGYETLVLRGASHVLAEIRPAIYFEVCPTLAMRAGFDPASPAQMLLDAGYGLNRLTDSGGLKPAKIGEISGIVLENWLAGLG